MHVGMVHVTLRHVAMIHMFMIHVVMMHVAMMHVVMMHVIMMHVVMMHVVTYDAHGFETCDYDPRGYLRFRGLEGQATELINKMLTTEGIDYHHDWKIITLFIGGNDLCRSCTLVVSIDYGYTFCFSPSFTCMRTY